MGLVESLAHPGGNLTGFVAAAPETAAKRFQIMKEVKPQAKRAAVLWNPRNSFSKLEWNAAKEFVAKDNIVVSLYDARDTVGLDNALAEISQAAPDMLVVTHDSQPASQLERLASFDQGPPRGLYYMEVTPTRPAHAARPSRRCHQSSGHQRRGTAKARAFLPALRRPHDHHRALRPRLDSASSPESANPSNQDRYVIRRWLSRLFATRGALHAARSLRLSPRTTANAARSPLKSP